MVQENIKLHQHHNLRSPKDTQRSRKDTGNKVKRPNSGELFSKCKLSQSPLKSHDLLNLKSIVKLLPFLQVGSAPEKKVEVPRLVHQSGRILGLPHLSNPVCHITASSPCSCCRSELPAERSVINEDSSRWWQNTGQWRPFS